jgi:hypothetical protein
MQCGGKRCRAYGVLGPSFVLGCSSVLVVEGACVRDCRRIGVCGAGTQANQQVVSV